MRRTKVLLSLAGLSLAACSNERVLISPELPAAVAWVAALLWDDDGALIHASGLVQRDASGAFVFEVDSQGAGGAARVSFVGYDEPQLAAYGLSPNDPRAETSLRVAQDGDRRLPEPPAFSGCTEQGTSSPTIAACDSPPLSSAWLSACPTACDFFPIGPPRAIPLPGSTQGARFATRDATSDAAALVYTDDGQIFRVTPASATFWTRVSTTTVIFDGFHRDDGSLLMVTTRSAVMSVRPSEEPAILARAPDLRFGREPQLAGAPSGSIEAFVSDGTGRLLAFDGARLTPFFEAPAGIPGCCASNLLWRGPDRLAACLSEANNVVVYEGKVVTVHEAIQRPRALAEVPGLGLVVAGRGGIASGGTIQFFVVRDGSWALLDDSGVPAADAGTEMWALEPGFLFPGSRGRLFYFDPDFGTCGPRSYSETNIDSVVVFPDSILLTAAVDPTDGQPALVWVADRVKQFPSRVGCTVH